MTSQAVLSDAERWRLVSFRRAAEQVRKASIVARGQRIEVRTAPGEPGYVDVYVQLLREEPFRSLALAIRLVYQQGEPAHFLSVCNILWRQGSANLKNRVADLRASYLATLRDPARDVLIGDDNEPQRFSAQKVFEHWLYGIAFHQDSDRERAISRLSSTGAMFVWSVQSMTLELADRILSLDDAIAEFLGET